MTATSRIDRFREIARQLGHDFEGEILVGGNYAPAVVHGGQLHISGQVPRVGTALVATGRVGDTLTLTQAQAAARVCAMRTLGLTLQALGSLEHVARVLKINVYVQCAPDFTQISEVADAASEVLHTVLGEAGIHARTSIGVYQLPKDAPVEIDLVAVIETGA
ncbi:MAG: RidA family protein [Burkholderiaceae bacterium]|nr:RidA family protein [Burkholderiaceae bacterium]